MSKQEVINLLQCMPDEIIFDKEALIDALYASYLKAGIKAGREDIKVGRTQTQEQIESMFCQ